jgi:nitrogen-specific signal transduction histidine kinase
VAPHYDPEDVRIALDLDPRVPAVLCDARQRDSVKQVLITLVEHVLASRIKNGSVAAAARSGSQALRPKPPKGSHARPKSAAPQPELG